ncbi:MAG: hypothetical protein ACHRXM_20190 [Isosphaerales bacterium]
MENRPDQPPWGAELVQKPITVGSSMVLQASAYTSERIHDLAVKNQMSDADLVKLGLALAEIMTRARANGNHLAVVDSDGKVIQDIPALRD